MNLPGIFIRRPIATLLLTLGLIASGLFAYRALPVAPLPTVDLPTIFVIANLPGASPETMATSVATPLERRLGTIAGVTEMTSSSSQGQTGIVLQASDKRDVNGLVRDIQAQINAARADLPATLRSNPTWRKFNPAQQPILILALTSKTKSPQQIYDEASIIIQQRIAQVPGVGDVDIAGSSLPAVRIELNPFVLARLGISGDDVRSAIAAAQGNRPKGIVTGGGDRFVIYTDRQLQKAADYASLIVAYRNGTPVRLRDLANVYDGPEDVNTAGYFNSQPAVIARITQAPGANIVQVVDAIRAQLPAIQAALPADIKLSVAAERTRTIRASLEEVEISLVISVGLVVLVVAIFLRSWRATVVPAIAVIASLMGTLSCMYLLGLSLNNISLMALVVATGFVVDDAIVVLENIARHVEAGEDRMTAALRGAKEVTFTVVAMTLSLIAVFLPLLLLGGIPGKIFGEFAVVLAVSVAISLVVSLTTTPMLAARLVAVGAEHGRVARWLERCFTTIERRYDVALGWAMDRRRLVLLMLAVTIGLNFYLYANSPSGFFPQQDTGQLFGGIRMDQSASFEASQQKVKQIVAIIQADPAVDTVTATVGGGRGGFGGTQMFINLKPKGQRPNSDVVTGRLRPKLARITGASTFLTNVQDLRVGGRRSNSAYQYTLFSDDPAELRKWAERLADAMRASPFFTDVDTDQQDRGVEQYVNVNADAAARLGLTNRQISSALYNAFGQRGVATIFNEVNQYRVIMEVDPKFSRDPAALDNVYVGGRPLSGVTASAFQVDTSATGQSAVSTGPAVAQPGAGPANALAPSLAQTAVAGGGGSPSGVSISTAPQRAVPLSTVASIALAAAPTSVNHQNTDAATTVSYNLAPGKTLSQANKEIVRLEQVIGMPPGVRGDSAGTAKAFRDTFSNLPLLFLTALLTIYLVLGILYESFVHPFTVLSTLPSAGVGALMALLALDMPLDLIGIIGIVLLIGIVKKNAILIIDFALVAERERGLTSMQAIREGAVLRFRPIIMTTLAAIFGALPLAIGFGEGSELRQPLGVAIIGGLIASQMLTLFTTPVVYLYLDRIRTWRKRRDARKAARRAARAPQLPPQAVPAE
ncbi:MAG: efflux RND transporter permease subunit [Sphingomonadaceae bacterium]|nr:efflux RND transporter permease subunit [Sphingomonadaceae bacterium]